MRLRARPLLALTVSILLAVTAAVHAQQSDRANALREQIDRIFKAREYDPPRFGPARWLPDGTAYAIVERPAGGEGSEIVRYDAATGARTVLVPSSTLIPPGAKPAGSKAPSSLEIADYTWSPDGKTLLIFTNTRRVWRQNTRGDYWILDVESGRLKKIGGSSPESSLMFAKFSPDSSRVAYVRANNIYVEHLSDARIADR